MAITTITLDGTQYDVHAVNASGVNITFVVSPTGGGDLMIKRHAITVGHHNSGNTEPFIAWDTILQNDPLPTAYPDRATLESAGFSEPQLSYADKEIKTFGKTASQEYSAFDIVVEPVEVHIITDTWS